MLITGLNRILFALMLLFVVAGCSKNSEIEGVLENYYRAAARGDTDTLEQLSDFSMFTLTTFSERGNLRRKIQQFIGVMNELSNANGELKKIEILDVKEVKEDNETFSVVRFNIIFKNDRTIVEKELITHKDGKAKVYMVNDWK